MGSYLDLQNSIASDLTRDDLGSQIRGAIQDAIKQYERQRFWFNTTRSMTFQTVAGQTAYTGADLAQIPYAIRIDDLFLRWSTSTFPLDREEPDKFEFLTGLPNRGKPTTWTYVDNQIMLWPIPLMAYTVRPHMHYRLTPLSADTDSNAWTNEAENLIRAHAKLILYTNVVEDPEGMQRIQAEIPGLKAGLDYETSARSATGRIRATDF
ncbi:hypothetical protein ACQR1H_03195 [Bradyrhizobium sp. HKCCYLRH2015]|uniref:phage adaptor protein n=1 Tax=Bradyrhizobium sp. HKCCYLRH2015 TaxID=3420742 RepID=UPI003EB70D11